MIILIFLLHFGQLITRDDLSATGQFRPKFSLSDNVELIWVEMLTKKHYLMAVAGCTSEPVRMI